MNGRLRWLLALPVLATTLASAAALEPEGHAWFPLAKGSRRSYVARSTLDPSAALHYEVTVLRATEAAEGGVRAVAKVLAHRWESGQPLYREEHYLADRRGVFMLSGADEAPAVACQVLPSESEVDRFETAWDYRGLRPRPMSLRLLGLQGQADTPSAAQGIYHVLSVGPLETEAAPFKRAVQVAGVEEVEAHLGGGRVVNVLLRMRRWYVRGVGLVREQYEFLDYPSMGITYTELTGYTGLAEDLTPGTRLDLARGDATPGNDATP